jgi:hypothetical protein
MIHSPNRTQNKTSKFKSPLYIIPLESDVLRPVLVLRTFSLPSRSFSVSLPSCTPCTFTCPFQPFCIFLTHAPSSLGPCVVPYPLLVLTYVSRPVHVFTAGPTIPPTSCPHIAPSHVDTCEPPSFTRPGSARGHACSFSCFPHMTSTI